MFDFFKIIFGVRPNDWNNPRSGSDLPEDLMDNILSGRRDDSDDADHGFHDDRRGEFGSHMRGFGFPIFSDPIEIHKYFESVLDEMNRQFSSFGFGPSITWKEETDNFSSPYFSEEPGNQTKNLRDSYLKNPGYISDRNVKKEDIDLDGQVKVDNIDTFLSKPGPSREDSQITQYSPKIFSKSVFIRTVRHPDGSVETIKKIRDHTGKEETIVTKEESSNPPGEPPAGPMMGPSMPDEDLPGLSTLRKFFSF